jgi:lipopolysaccharide transport system ATP-binding protein
MTGVPDRIIVENLGKSFARYHAEKPKTIMAAALSGWRRIRPIEAFWALREVSFSVAPGEMLGIIGHNGAGKSTLLQLLGKITRPTEGRIQIKGRIGALLDLGAGFHGDLTGRENVLCSAIVAGLKRPAAKAQLDEIVAFAELDGFIDNPVRTYSTGMMMRLAFSTAIHTQPEVLLVDEFLSVGDLAFQTKCLQRIQAMKQQGTSIVLISHSVKQVQDLCDRALWLRQGEVVAYGSPQVVAGQYKTAMQTQTRALTPDLPAQLTRSGQELKINQNRFGSLEAEITDVVISPSSVQNGQRCGIEIHYSTKKPIASPHFSVSITRPDGSVCLDTNTEILKFPVKEIKASGKITLVIDRLDLTGGEYFVNVGIFERKWDYAYDYHWHVYGMTIGATVSEAGMLAPPMRWTQDVTARV